MFTSLQGQKIMYTTSFVGKVCRKNPGFNKGKTAGMFGLTLYVWPCIFHFPLCTSQGIKVPFENEVTGLARRSLVTPCLFFSFFLSLTLFFRLTPWSIEALCVHLSTQVSKTWMGRCSASSLPRETGRAPAASVNRASSLSRGFIGFLCKARNISLFLSSIFLSTIFFPYLSLNHLPMPFFL